MAFVTDRTIRSLNRRFLRRDHVTDVLAFDYSPVPVRAGAISRRRTLEGEIIISTETARRQSRIFSKTFEQELTLYIVHGVLHLLGYDDHRPADIKRMRARERKILRNIDRR